MPAKVLRAACEVRLASGRVVDVALLGRADLVIAAVEVHHTHAVDEDKALALPAPWVEVEAEQVCATRGRLLDPVRARFLPWLCEEHAPARRALGRAPREDAQRRTRALRRLPFGPADFAGFEAGPVVRCPNGHDAILWQWQGAEPPWPRPPLVVARERERDGAFSRTAGRWREVLPFRRRWVSTCATCGADLDEPG